MKIPQRIKKRIKKTIFTTILTMTVVASNIPMALFAQSSEVPKGYIAITVEKFTLGLGYIQEPIKVPFYEGDTYADITVRVLGEGNSDYVGDTKQGFYLSKIKDDDTREVNVPEYILNECGSVDSRQQEGWLGEFDYTYMSGWMYAVDNDFPDVGAADKMPEDGDVCRWQFTTYGSGRDLGEDAFGTGEPYINTANKDDLTEEVAEINSSEDKNNLLKDKEIKEAYEQAYEVLEDMTSTQSEVDKAHEKLSNAVDEEVDTPENPSVVIPQISVDESISKSSAYLYSMTTNPTIGTGGGEWTILSLARGEYGVDSNYYDKYYDNVVNVLTEKNGILHKVKYTEYSRVILGLTSIGKDPTNVGGYNLVEKLADFNSVIKQGINGPIFALIALDSNNYEIPQVEGVSKQTTRDNLIEYILDKEIKQEDGTVGGWALSGTSPDPDVTAMALQALSTYKDTTITKEDGSQVAVKPYIDRALNVLSDIQLENGGYMSWNSENVESASQVLVALTSLGIDPKTDERFIKGDGNWLVSNIMEYQTADGGFEHIKGTGTNGMATDQATYALVSYKRFVEGKTKLYDMSDMFNKSIITPEINEVLLSAPEKISAKKDTEFDVIVKSGAWPEGEFKLLDALMEIPSSVNIESIEVSKNLTGGMVDFNVGKDNKLRLVYTNTELDKISFEEGDLVILKCKLKEDIKDDLTFKINEVNLKSDSQSTVKMNVDNASVSIGISESSGEGETPGGGETPELVSIKTLYQGDGSDLIDSNKKAIAISFSNVGENQEILFKDDVKLYYSEEFTSRLSNTTYVALVDSSITDDELNNIGNYKFDKDNKSEAILFADTDDNQKINAQDALNNLSTWLRKSKAPNDKGIMVMNVNGDSKIDTSDALAVVEKYIKDKDFLVLSK